MLRSCMVEQLSEKRIGEKTYTATLSLDSPPYFHLTIYEDQKVVFTASFKEKSWAVNYYNNFLREKEKSLCGF